MSAGSLVAHHRLCDLPGVEGCELTETVLLLVDTAGCLLNEFTTSDGISKGNPRTKVFATSLFPNSYYS